jgi:hypothetical protein
MATHVMTAPKRGFRHVWVPLLAAVALVALIGVAFAAGRNSAPNPTPARAAVQGTLGSQLTGMMPWMRSHTGDIRWMQGHMGDVTWMQAHPTQWQWMQAHMRDIGWMHDHWGQWTGWRSSTNYGTGSGSNGSGTGMGNGWNCGQWC